MMNKNVLIVKRNKTITGLIVKPLYHSDVTGHAILFIAYLLYISLSTLINSHIYSEKYDTYINDAEAAAK